jgi:LSD1 subclass zinc finger protein
LGRARLFGDRGRADPIESSVMQPLRCARCDAPIDLPPEATSVECAYCRQIFRAPREAAPEVRARVVRVEGPPVEEAARQPRVAIGSAVVAVIGKIIGLIVPLAVLALIWSVTTGVKPLRWLGLAAWEGKLLPGGWEGKTPLVCSGNDRMEIRDITATFASGTAITATGNCEVHLTNCTLRAPTAIEAAGNARVFLVGGTVQGNNLSVNASGNARVESQGTKFLGRAKQSGNARIPN